jgi:predicted 2-oxoglutarate/Fe(II)-dependent dioxygenase YbiX
LRHHHKQAFSQHHNRKRSCYEDNVDYDTTYTDDPDSYIGTETVVNDVLPEQKK